MAIRSKNYTKKIAYIAILTALSCIFNYFTFFVDKVFSISLIMVPSFVAGVFIGPIGGFLVGFLGDLIVGLLFPQGAYLITIGLSAGLFGLIPGVIFKYFKINNDFLKILISFALMLIVCTIAINTTTFWVLYSMAKGKTYWVYLWGRLPAQLLNTAINMVFCIFIYRFLVNENIIHELKRKPKRNDLTNVQPVAVSMEVEEGINK